MSEIFRTIIFPPLPKKEEVVSQASNPSRREKTYIGNYEFWFERTTLGLKLMVACPKCSTEFCLEKGIPSEKSARIGMRTQGYYFLDKVRKNCPKCNSNNIHMYT